MLAGVVLILAALAGCGTDGVTNPLASDPDCALHQTITHGDSVFTVTAWYPDTSTLCRSLR